MQRIDQQALAQWAESHQTDARIAEAIFYVAGDDDEAERIWQDPENDEAVAIWERATQNGLESDDMPWGESNLRDVMAQFSGVRECEICSHAGIYTPATTILGGKDVCDACFNAA